MTRVLLVEDDLIISRIYQGLLRKQGYEVTVASDGESAIRALTECQPGLVLLDLMLPKINGVEVLKHIRSNPVWRELPVIVCSNAAMGPLVSEALEAGASHCLVKAQTRPRELIETVSRFLPSSTAAASS